MSQHIKPYDYQRVPSRQENRKFYDEKEWRYVPDAIGFENLIIYPYLYKSKEELQLAIEKANEQIKIRHLNFEPNHINIIIIDKEIDRREILETLEKTCNEKGFNDFEQLATKVKTIDQIEKLEIDD